MGQLLAWLTDNWLLVTVVLVAGLIVLEEIGKELGRGSDAGRAEPCHTGYVGAGRRPRSAKGPALPGDATRAPNASSTSPTPSAAPQGVAADALRASHPTWLPPPRTRAEAEAQLDEIAAYCRNCPIRSRCATEACRVWHEEAAAVAVLRADDIPLTLGP